MKKSLLIMLALLVAVSMVFVSCSDASEANNGTAKTGEIFASNSNTKGLSITDTSTVDVDSLHWYYTAVKNDTGIYHTGETKTFKAVSSTAMAGLTNQSLGQFSYGNWSFTFIASVTALTDEQLANISLTTPESGSTSVYYKDSELVAYCTEPVSTDVDKDKNYIDVYLEEGKAIKTDITIGAISFSSSDATGTVVFPDGATFTISGVDKCGDTTVGDLAAASGKSLKATVSNNAVTFASGNLVYTKVGSDFTAGDHVMTFTLKQDTVSGTTQDITNVAVAQVSFTLVNGHTYTISGTLNSAESRGEVIVNGHGASVTAITADKIVPVNSADDKTVKTATTVTTSDLSVTYPVGAKLASDTATVTNSENVEKADANIGFEYVSTEAPTGITLATDEANLKYDLTLNVDTTSNTKLITVTKFVGKDMTVLKVYHDGTEVSTSESDTAEYYSYDEITGILTLHVFHASNIDVVYEKAIAVAQIGNEKYTTLDAAFEAAQSGDTITLLADIEGPGIGSKDASGSSVGAKGSLTIDFNTHTYTVVNNAIGSTGTETQAMHWGTSLSSIIMKNGTFAVSEAAATAETKPVKMAAQIYIPFTAKNMTFDFSKIVVKTYPDEEPYKTSYPEYVGKEVPMFNNNMDSGLMYFKDCTITMPSASTKGISAGNYTIMENTTVTGAVNLAYMGESLKRKGTTSISKGVVSYFDGYTIVSATDGDYTVYTIDAIVENTTKGLKYGKIQDAFDEAASGDTVKMLKDYTANEVVEVTKSITFDTNGKTVTLTGDTVNDAQQAFQVLCNSTDTNVLTITGTGTIQSSYGVVCLYSSKAGVVVDGPTLIASKGSVIESYGANIVFTNDYSSCHYDDFPPKDRVATVKSGTLRSLNGCNDIINFRYGLLSACLEDVIFEAKGDSKVFFLDEGSVVTMKNCTITSEDYGIDVTDNAQLTVENVTFSAKNRLFYIQNSTGSVEIKSGTFTITDSSKWLPVSITSGATFKVTGGTYNWNIGDSNTEADYAVVLDASNNYVVKALSEVTGQEIVGGTFTADPSAKTVTDYAVVMKGTNYQVKLVSGIFGNMIVGGVFRQDPSSKLASGYVATKNETTGLWTVSSQSNPG